MKQIWKYSIKDTTITHKIPEGGIVRHVDEQFDRICIWVEVDPYNLKEDRCFEVYGTGAVIKEDMSISREYLGSVKLDGGTYIFHIYECII